MAYVVGIQIRWLYIGTWIRITAALDKHSPGATSRLAKGRRASVLGRRFLASKGVEVVRVRRVVSARRDWGRSVLANI